MSEIDEPEFEKVTFGSSRRPAWQRWEGFSDGCEGDSFLSSNPPEHEQTVNGVSLETDFIPHSHISRSRQRYRSTVGKSRAQGDDKAPHPSSRWDCKAVHVKSPRRHKTALLKAASKLAPLSEREEAQSDTESTTDDSHLNEMFSSSDENESNSLKQTSITDPQGDTDASSTIDTNTPPTPYIRNKAHIVNDCSAENSKSEGKLIVGKEGGDRREILVCNGHVDTVIFESPTEASETLNEIEEQSHSERQENELNKDEQLRPGEIPHITAESPTQPEPKTTQEIPASIPEHPPEYKHEESVHRDEENEQRTEIV
ncbi:unnamed protein product, partial [Toxocara canis]|uniref:Uncharacterized protein n=1 Tax=Toxocara canis TaxID=6265 RepID=A0A183VC24_TOXCA